MVYAENRGVKGKFPLGLKPLLEQIGLWAVLLNEYDDILQRHAQDLFLSSC